MLFMTYKPRSARNVKAERVTASNIEEIAASFYGTARIVNDKQNPVHLMIATLAGVMDVALGQWIVRTEDGIEIWDDSEFNEKFERARGSGEPATRGVNA